MRSRAAAGLLLLALTAHAFVASATHFHRLASPGASPAQAALQGREERGQGAPQAGDERQCLLCRLQRNLVSDVLHESVAVEPSRAHGPGYYLRREDPAHAARTQLPPGRAPPSSHI